MNIENLSTLKIHKLTQEQYDRELENGNIDENAIYLTPNEEIDLSSYVTVEHVNDNFETKVEAIEKLTEAKTYTDIVASGKSDSNHNHDSDYDVIGSASESLILAKSYTDSKVANLTSTTVVDNKISSHNTSTSAHNDIRALIFDLTTKLNNFLDVDETTTDQLSEVLTLIENNKGTLESLTITKINVSDIINNLTTNSTSKVLSAAQGVAIKTLIDVLQEELDSHTHTISDVSGLQSALDGKAASSHGTHVTYSTTAPVMDGTASAGSAITVARSDHKHPTDTSRASKTEFDTHVANATKHITSTERTNWNAAKSHADSAHAPSNAEANQNAFSNIAVSGQTTVAADSKTDTLTLAGSNVSITTDANNDKVTFAVADGTTSAKGVVQLTNSTSSTSTTTAATPNSVKSAYDLANQAKTAAATAQATADSKADASHTHNYAGSSSAGGAATSANKVNSSLTVKLNGGTTENTNLFTFNGSAAKTVNITPSSIGASASGHTHDDRYYTESEVDSKLSGKANTSHGNHVPTTETASNARFLRNDNTWQNVTPANIGAAAASHTHSANNIVGGYLNTHPENGGTVVPFINNDIAFLLKRGGSAVLKFDNVVQNRDISVLFDGTPSYFSGINFSTLGYTSMTIELTLHKTFTWTNTIYIDHGSSTWRAKNLKIEVINTAYANDVWTTKKEGTNIGSGNTYVTFTHTPVGATNAGGGFNKIRFTLSNWNSPTDCRIACLGLVNYGSTSIQETVLSKGGGSVYGSITPYSNNNLTLGSSTNKWNNVYATTFTGALSGNAATATNVAWTGVTGKPSYYDAKAIKGITRSGTTFTYTCMDGTTGTFTQQDNNTTYSAATQSAQGLMSAADKTKLDGIATGANKITVDTAMSTTSTNPVQNKVVQAAINALRNEFANGSW